MNDRRHAIVLSSFTVHPDMPSEPGIGWQFLIATLEHARTVGATVILVTMRRSAQACSGRIPAEFEQHLEIVTVEIPLAPPFFRWHYPRFTRIEHELWVRLAVKHIREIDRTYSVVYAHHVTFASEILSTPITRMSPSTYKVWGPIGAGGVAEVFAISPTSSASRRQWFLQTARDQLASIPAKHIARRCNLVLAQNGAMEATVAQTDTRCRRFPNVVVDLPTTWPVRTEHDGIVILVVGHLITRKRQELAIEALASSRLQHAHLHIVGFDSTSHGAYLYRRAKTLGVQDRVTFHGSLDRAAVLDMMVQSDVLMHPSGREGASGVVGEAAACGLPVVCFERTGASSVLEDSRTSGVVLPADSATTRDMMAEAIVRASTMQRISTTQWTKQRFVDLASQLYAEGLAFDAAPPRRAGRP
ncbi:glycosyltransferase family 4 protein [Rhodococcoides fascians A25f]|uniref:glycosyltransferase family 4 protein n=1 Tax=Rhodococcoides fascians TaxID=1828 RepID=UPI0012D2E42D|nr:glycosyltransferase family 4 protein [Rhodococcus fascians]QII08106.1 glycosyltransferase family 4 protein [Rhodococcus fascians A25f]